MRRVIPILVLFVILGFIYATTTPIFEASDELWHYPFVRHLADGNPLPVQDPANVGPWKQEASQQPLYYALTAALSFWVDSSDMEQVRWLNPHVDNGILTPDGNTNLVIHRPEQEAFPWHGTVLAVRLIRLVSVLMGAGTVYFAWRFAQYLFPERPELALAAAAVTAFTPMFLFISGAVNNDNLTMLLSSASLLLMVRFASQSQQSGQWSLRQSLSLGCLLGLAALTKTSALGLVPLALGTLVVASGRSLQARGWRAWLKLIIGRGLVMLLPILLIAGWWYIRNVRLYGDLLGWSAFIQVLGKRAHPASLRQLWGERWGFSLSYWGLFGGVNVPMPAWIYHLLNGTVAVAAVGFLVYLVRTLTQIDEFKQLFRERQAGLVWSRLLSIAHRLWPLVLLIGWSAGIMVGLVRWATTTWSSQGRLVFPAITALSTLLVVGLFGWIPRRPGRPISAQPTTWGAALLGGFMFVIAAIAPFCWIGPAYRPSPSPTQQQVDTIQHTTNVDLGDKMRLLGYDLPTREVEPGGELALTLYWQVLAPMEQDWSLFVHLNDPVIGAPIAQRDMYPGQGLLATSLLEPGQQLADRIVIQVPPTVYAPAEAELAVGLYNYVTGERLLMAGGQSSISLETISIQSAQETPYPNPVRFNFADQMALIGYQVEPRRLYAGETLTLTLYWEALDEMEIDYTIFTHLRDLEDPSNRIYAQHDAPPPNGTLTWHKGDVIETPFSLTLAEDTPAGVHEIEIGIYHRDEAGGFPRLALVTPDGRIVDDFLILGKVRVD